MNSYTFILISLVLFLFPYLGKIWFNRNTLTSTVVSLGLFCTFCGIIWALFNFDVNDIEAALPQLLNRIKTTFYSSVAGMLTSIVLKVFPAFYGIRTTKNIDRSSPSKEDRIVELLSNIEQKIGTATSSETIDNLFNKLNTTLIESHKKQIERTDELSHINQKLSDSLNAIGTAIEKWGENTNKTHHTDYENINKQQSVLDSEIINLNASCKKLDLMINNTKELLQEQMNNVEERFVTKLDSMQEFSQTLLAIVRKLTQDHNAILKQQHSEQEPPK